MSPAGMLAAIDQAEAGLREQIKRDPVWANTTLLLLAGSDAKLMRTLPQATLDAIKTLAVTALTKLLIESGAWDDSKGVPS